MASFSAVLMIRASMAMRVVSWRRRRAAGCVGGVVVLVVVVGAGGVVLAALGAVGVGIVG